MKPDLEVIQIGQGQSFKVWEHGYPFHTVRWHFHPEYELHHVVHTTGRYFVGDFIGTFEPGNLVLTGPNLPHNWVSEVSDDAPITLRNRCLNFSESFIQDAFKLFPELGGLTALLERSRSGLLFPASTEQEVAPLLEELVRAIGIRRIELFMGVVRCLAQADGAQLLTSASYKPDPAVFMSTGINEVLAYINENLTESFTESDLARIAGLTPGAFSRSFRRHTGMGLVTYVNRLRINLACQLLMSDEDLTITDVCFASGFNNISNFNRHFQTQKGMTPSRFRKLLAENVNAVLYGGEARMECALT